MSIRTPYIIVGVIVVTSTALVFNPPHRLTNVTKASIVCGRHSTAEVTRVYGGYEQCISFYLDVINWHAK